MNEPEMIADYACVTGEGPLWHPGEGRLYWLDIPRGRIFRYDPASGHHEICYDGDVVGGMTLQADGALLLFMDRGAVKVWRDGALTTLLEEIADERESRFNDVIAEPMGRVFCGTMPSPHRPGRLYRLNPDLSLSVLFEEIGCSNGMGFTPDRKQMYYTDSTRREITLCNYDERHGGLTNRRRFVRTPDDEQEGIPDGMTVDAEGCIWSARWDGACLVRYTPDAREERRVEFPARKVSSATFGGSHYEDLYVTTAGGDQKERDGPLAGALFGLRPGVRGVPEFVSRIGR